MSYLFKGAKANIDSYGHIGLAFKPTNVLRAPTVTTTIVAGTAGTIYATLATGMFSQIRTYSTYAILIIVASLAGFDFAWESRDEIIELYSEAHRFNTYLANSRDLTIRLIETMDSTHPAYNILHDSWIDIETARVHMETIRSTLINIEPFLRFREW